MNEALSQDDDALEFLVAEVVDDFLARQRRGERPDVEEYAARYPEQRSAVREVLAAMRLLHEASNPGGSAERSTLVAGEPESVSLKQLGDYLLLREVGRGGMGIVYEAEQVSLRRRVALKVLPLGATLDPRHLQRFKNEALAVASLNHPNIVEVYSVGCESSISYYAMRYVPGHSLAETIRRLRTLQRERPQPLPDSLAVVADPVPSTTPAGAQSSQSNRTDNPVAIAAKKPAPNSAQGNGSQGGNRGGKAVFHAAYFRCVAEMAVQVAEALEHAHTQGVIHRDIKPSNLLLDGRGKVWVADFGLAHVEREASLTASGDVVGTWRYMAPEQTCGQRTGIEPRSDVYGLGVTLYETLTLQPAFLAADPKVLARQIIEEEPAAPRRLNPAIPVDLETIVLHAMAKEPSDRYATAQDLADDLRRFLNDEPIQARPPSWRQKATRWVRRHQPVVWTTVIAVVLVLLLGIVGQRIHTRDLIGALARARQAEQKARSEYAYSLISEARWRRQSRQPGQMLESRKLVAEAASILLPLNPDEEQILRLRNEAIAAEAVPADLALVRTLKTLHVVDADFRLYAWSDIEGTIRVHRLADGKELHRFLNPGGNYVWGQLLFSPDGKFLGARANRGKNYLRLWSLAQERPVVDVSPPPDCCAWDFTPDGSQFLFGTNDRALHILDLTTLRERGPLPLPKAPRSPYRFKLSPDSKLLAISYGQNHSHIDLVDFQTGMLVKTLRQPGLILSDLDWDRDSRHLAVSGDRAFQVQIWNVETAKVETVLSGHRWWGIKPALSPHDDLLMTHSWDGTARLWDSCTGQEYLFLRPSGDACYRSDGRQLILTGTQARLWEIHLGRVLRRLPISTPPDRYLDSIDLGLDGRLVATSNSAGVHLYDLQTRREIACLPIGLCVRVVFHPRDGSLITSGVGGVHRWPLHLVRENENGEQTDQVVCIGSPELLVSSPSTKDVRIALTPDGRTLAAQGWGTVIVRDLKLGTEKRLSGGQPQPLSISISPDGRWVATAGWYSYGIRLWDLSEGKLLEDLWPGAEMQNVLFSPDGHWLLASSKGRYRCWEVGTWRRTHRFEKVGPGSGHMAFSSNGSVVALSPSRVQPELYEAATGRCLATLVAPDAFGNSAMSFSRDGSRLGVLDRPIMVWDLREVRRGLRDLKLDWDRPPYPNATLEKRRGTIRLENLTEAMKAWKKLHQR
jgi:eukaryotic-like serine/threonine-protein kinase